MVFPSKMAGVHSPRNERMVRDHDELSFKFTGVVAEAAETKKRLAALLPRNVVRKKVKKWTDLTPEQKNLLEMPPGRFAGSDPENDIGLRPTL